MGIGGGALMGGGVMAGEIMINGPNMHGVGHTNQISPPSKHNSPSKGGGGGGNNNKLSPSKVFNSAVPPMRNSNQKQQQQHNHHIDVVQVPNYKGSNWVDNVIKKDANEDNLKEIYEDGFAMLMQEQQQQQ